MDEEEVEELRRECESLWEKLYAALDRIKKLEPEDSSPDAEAKDEPPADPPAADATPQEPSGGGGEDALQRIARSVDEAVRRLNEFESRMEAFEARLDQSDADSAPNGETGEIDEPDDPYTPGAHDEVEPDSNVHAEGELPNRSIQWVPEQTSVLELNDFHEELSATRKVELKATTTTGTGGGTKIELVDPDGNPVPGTKWQIPLRFADTSGQRKLLWAAIGGSVDAGAAAAASQLPYAPSDYDPKPPSDYDPTDPDPIYVPVPDPVYDPDNPAHDKPYIYLPIDGFFWLRGGTAATNYGRSLKLGNDSIGYVTISVTR